MDYPQIDVVDMHTGGEPLRIITSGYPAIEGRTILDKRRHVSENLDHLRRFLMFEPRGHREMYGALLVEPLLPEADMAVLFMHNGGYSTMCGHAVIALARFAVDEGIVERTEPTTHVGIECPCGLVKVVLDVITGDASFVSVPAFAMTLDQPVVLSDGRRIVVDISYGGAFYALVEDSSLGVDLHDDPIDDLVGIATDVTNSVKSQIPISHPDSVDLAFLYGTIITDDRLTQGKPTRNLCVFADAQVDRSPTGSGVTARLAAAYKRKQVTQGQCITFRSIVDSSFQASVVDASPALASDESVRVRVSGKAYYSGRSTFRLEEEDTLGRGFLVR